MMYIPRSRKAKLVNSPKCVGIFPERVLSPVFASNEGKSNNTSERDNILVLRNSETR